MAAMFLYKFNLVYRIEIIWEISSSFEVEWENGVVK